MANTTVDGSVLAMTGHVVSYGKKRAADGNAWTEPGVVDVVSTIAVVPAYQ